MMTLVGPPLDRESRPKSANEEGGLLIAERWWGIWSIGVIVCREGNLMFEGYTHRPWKDCVAVVEWFAVRLVWFAD